MLMMYVKIAGLLFGGFLIGCIVGGFFQRLFSYDAAQAYQREKIGGQHGEGTHLLHDEPYTSVMDSLETKSMSVSGALQSNLHGYEQISPAMATSYTTSSTSHVNAAPVNDVLTEGDSDLEMKRPMGLFAPRDDRADDLKLIKGIGPTNERKLNQIGIYHFDQIAGWSYEEAEWINSFLEFPGRVAREEWVKQAQEFVRNSGRV